MPKHIHAEQMAQYAQDAMETDTPWDRWQFKSYGRWTSLKHHPVWDKKHKYRRKPKTSRERFEEWRFTDNGRFNVKRQGMWKAWQEAERQALEMKNDN